MNNEIRNIFEKNKSKLVEELETYVKARGNIECIPNTMYLHDEHLFPTLIEIIDGEVFVRYYDDKADFGVEGRIIIEHLSEFDVEQLYQIFNCTVEITENEICALTKALEESLEREKVAQKVIEDLRKRLG